MHRLCYTLCQISKRTVFCVRRVHLFCPQYSSIAFTADSIPFYDHCSFSFYATKEQSLRNSVVPPYRFLRLCMERKQCSASSGFTSFYSHAPIRGGYPGKFKVHLLRQIPILQHPDKPEFSGLKSSLLWSATGHKSLPQPSEHQRGSTVARMTRRAAQRTGCL